MKLKKGKPITELVKGSMEYTISLIYNAFRAQFPYIDGMPNYYIAENFADYVTVTCWGPNSPLKVDEYFKVNYTRNGEEIIFAAIADWEVVELAYQPQTVITESKKKSGKRFDEVITPGQVQLLEARDDKKGTRRIRINGLVVANKLNGNKRIYGTDVIEAMVADWRSHLHESAGQGRLKILTGEVEHPADKGNKRTEYLETVVRWDTLDWNGEQLNIEGDLILTTKGKDVEILMEAGVNPGGSIRGVGEAIVEKVNGEPVERVLWVSMNGADLVGDPSFKNTAELQESNKQGENEMNLLEQLKALMAEHPELFKGITEAQLAEMGEKQLKKLEKEIREALGIGADANITESLKTTASKAKQFDELQEQKAVEEAITEATKDLPFGDKLNKRFVEALKSAGAKTPEEVKVIAEAKRKEYGEIASDLKLKTMGFNGGKTGVQVLGDVIESETGHPEYARVALEIAESVTKHENRAKRALVQRAESPAAVFTEKLLKRFDQINQRQLMQEAQIFLEAETTTDLNLPYSVARGVIAEAFPNLVAANVFDVGIMDQNPMKIFYEAFSGETGYEVAVTDEVEAMGAEGDWYDLTNKNIVPGTVVVTSDPAGTTYVEGTDFIIDYELGKIQGIAGGSIDANDVLVDYTYHATRKGENAEIERAKTTLSSQTIEAIAFRVADYITHEAIVFSRSQLGWDAVGRTMANLIRQVRRDIDRSLIEKALAMALSLGATNSGGTWDISDANYDDLVKKLGVAKVLVANRFYEPTSYLLSKTNSDYLSNWDGFKRDGFPNALLNAAGFAGTVKGLPVFDTTELRDTWMLCFNREIVMHRVYLPMTVKGPFPTYSNGKLVAAEQYYAEEYNANLAPIAGKASYVKTQA